MENFGLHAGTALPTRDFHLNSARGLLSWPRRSRRSRGTRAGARKMRAIRVLESLPYPPGSDALGGLLRPMSKEL